MLHTPMYLAALQKVEAQSTFPATHNAVFHCETCCVEGVSHVQFSLQLVSTPLHCKLQKKLPRVRAPLGSLVLLHVFSLYLYFCEGVSNGLASQSEGHGGGGGGIIPY